MYEIEWDGRSCINAKYISYVCVCVYMLIERLKKMPTKIQNKKETTAIECPNERATNTETRTDNRQAQKQQMAIVNGTV